MTSTVEAPKVVQITPPAESLLITHTQNHEAYHCPEELCTFTTSSPSLLGLHKAQVHKIKTRAKKGVTHQYFCPAPGCHFNPQSKRFFKVLDHLKTHYMKVHVEKKFKCSKCQRAFGLERDCLRHEKECGQTFTCTECGKEYNKKSALNMHCLSKGHRPPPSIQKASQTAKNDSKITPKKSQLKDKRMAMATVPILPKFPLPCNMSIVIPSQRMEATQSLCETVDAMKQVTLIAQTNMAGDTENSNQPKNDISKILIKAGLPQEMPDCGNNLAAVSFNKNVANSAAPPFVALYSSEGLKGRFDSQILPITSSVSVIRVNSENIKQNTDVPRGSKSQGKRRSQKHASEHLILPPSVASLNGANQTNGIVTFQSHTHRWPSENVSQMQDNGIHQDIFLSSSSSTLPLPPTSQSEPLTKKLKALSCHPTVPISNFPATIPTHSALPIHHVSSTEESLDSGTALTYVSNGAGISKVCASDYNSMTDPLEYRNSSSHLPPARDITSQSEESNEVQKGLDDLSNLHSAYSDTQPCLQNGLALSKKDCTTLSSAQTQTCVPYTTSDLVNDIETQTLESFLLDSLNSLLSDCETQTFESSDSPYNFLNDIETQTFESLPAISTLVNDNETQTNEISPGFCGLVNNSETQTLENAESLYQLLNDCETDRTERNGSVCNLFGESGTQTSLKTTSDSVTQTLGTVMLDSISQTSTDMNGSRENVYSLENPINFPSADISCQVDTDDLFMNDPLTTLDIMTQTLDDYNLNSEPLLATPQTLLLKEAGIQTGNKLGSSASKCLIFTSQREAQNAMNQTTNDSFNSSQTLGLDGPESSVLSDRMQVIDRLETAVSTQNFATSFDMPSSLFDSFDSWSTSVEIPDSPAESIKILGSGKQGRQAVDNTDAVTQTLCQNDCTHPALSIMDSITQTQEFSDSMTQTFKSSSSAKSVHSKTQTSLQMFDSTTQTQMFDATVQSSETFDSMTQTMAGCDTLTQVADKPLCEGSVRQNMVIFNPLSQTASSFENMTETADSFDNMTKTANSFENMTQTISSFDTMTQTGNSFDNMMQTVSSFDTMTQTVKSFDNMTQTANNFEPTFQTDDNDLEALSQAANSLDMMTQTAYNLDNMTQTAYNLDNMTQTAYNLDNMTQTAYNLDNMTQTAYNLDNMTQTVHLLDSAIQTSNSFDSITQTASNFEMLTQIPDNQSAMTQTANVFDSFDFGCENFTQTEEMKSVWEMTTQTDGFPVQGSDIMTQTVDDGLWEMMTQTENDLMSDVMTQTGPDDLWEEITTQTDIVQGSNQTTQTTDKDLWEMMTQTEEELVSDMMTQTGESSNVWGLCSQDSFDLTCNIFTQTEKNGLWETTTQTEAIMGSDMMTQTQETGLWEMTTQTDKTMDKNLWEITTQTDEIMECDMMTQTVDNSFREITSLPEADLASDMMSQTADIDFQGIASQATF